MLKKIIYVVLTILLSSFLVSCNYDNLDDVELGTDDLYEPYVETKWPSKKYPEPIDAAIIKVEEKSEETLINISWKDKAAIMNYAELLRNRDEYELYTYDQENSYMFKSKNILISYDSNDADSNKIIIYK